MNKELVNHLRLESGISRTADGQYLVCINKEGNIIAPLEGLETFANLIVTDCMIEIERLIIRNGDTEHNRALSAAWQAISDKFGVKST